MRGAKSSNMFAEVQLSVSSQVFELRAEEFQTEGEAEYRVPRIYSCYSWKKRNSWKKRDAGSQQ